MPRKRVKNRRSKAAGQAARPGWLLALTGALATCTLTLLAQPVPFGRIKNFSVPEYYAPPNQNQVKSLISGAEAEPQPEGRFLIKDLTAETYRENGEREIVIRAPECLYDSAKRGASSAGRLQIQSGDGRLLIEGEGFLWRQDGSTLIISNRGHTMIRQQPRKPEQTEEMNRTLTALAVGTGMVLAAQAQTDLRTMTNVPAPVHTNAPGATNAARFQAGDTDIFSDVIELDWTAHLVVFRGSVRVEKPGLHMTCELLTSNLPERGGRITNVVAEQGVVFDAEDAGGQKMHGTGGKGVYTCTITPTATNEIIELRGNPVVKTDKATVTGDVITYNFLTGKIGVTGGYKISGLEMPTRIETTGATNAAESTNAPGRKETAATANSTNAPPGAFAPTNSQPSGSP